MCGSINLHHHSCLDTIKINHIRADWILPSEFATTELTITKIQPQPLFYRTDTAAKRACALFRVHTDCASRTAPHPCSPLALSFEGEGGESNVKIFHCLGVSMDEALARFHLVAHASENPRDLCKSFNFMVRKGLRYAHVQRIIKYFDHAFWSSCKFFPRVFNKHVNTMCFEEWSFFLVGSVYHLREETFYSMRSKPRAEILRFFCAPFCYDNQSVSATAKHRKDAFYTRRWRRIGCGRRVQQLCKAMICYATHALFKCIRRQLISVRRVTHCAKEAQFGIRVIAEYIVKIKCDYHTLFKSTSIIDCKPKKML